MSELHDTTRAPTLTGPWRTSTFTNQGNCVEMAPTARGIALRNSNDHGQGILLFTHAELAAALAGTKAGQLDDLML